MDLLMLCALSATRGAGKSLPSLRTFPLYTLPLI